MKGLIMLKHLLGHKPDSAKSQQPLKLGVKARDRVTGITGIVDMRLEMLTGSVQYSIQPEGDGSSRPEGYAFDWQLIEVLGPGVSDKVPPIETSPIRLGDKVEDITTGFTGVVIETAWHLNGCVSHGVAPRVNEKGEQVPAFYLNHKRLKVIKVEAVKQSPEAVKPVKTRTGGPTRNSSAMRAS